MGRIVSVSSLAGLMPRASTTEHPSARGSINTIVASVVKAVAGDGITVNAVSPGTIRSETLEKRSREVAIEGGFGLSGPLTSSHRCSALCKSLVLGNRRMTWLISATSELRGHG